MRENEPQLKAFYDWARAAGWTQDDLAYECDCNRSQISLVLSGHRPGRYTWRRLVRFLPMEAVLLLQQCSSWNSHATAALARRQEREKLQELARKCREPEAVNA